MDKFNKSFRGFSYFFEDTRLKLVLWLENYWGEYFPVDVLSLKKLRTGEYVCKVCNNYADSLEDGYCADCFELDEQHQIWLNCLYNKKESFINTIGCTRADPACGIPAHLSKCYTRYFLYLGRIGSLIKVGITRKGRLGGFWGRFLEQGLNEAILVDSLENLPLTSKEEKWFKDLGFPDSIKHEEKVEQLLQRKHKKLDIGQMQVETAEKEMTTYLFSPDLYSEQLLSEFPHDLWNERFPTKKIRHFLVFPDVGYSGLKSSKLSLKGKICWFQGSLVVSSYRQEYFMTNLKDLLHREITELRRI